MSHKKREPKGHLAIRTIAMPADTNPGGDIFGGWLVSQMDLAAQTVAHERAKCRVVTVAINSMSFIAPVHVGDAVCCYVELIKVGRTSMQVNVEAWAVAPINSKRRQVTEGIFTFVALNKKGKPCPV